MSKHASMEEARPVVTILYATQTGNAELVAEDLFLQFLSADLPARLFSLQDYPVKNISKERYVLLLVSTTGQGCVPDDGVALFDALSNRQLVLPGLQYGVLALGSRHYAQFCQAGRDFDALLTAAGAQRMLPRMDCDEAFEEDARHWSVQALHRCQLLHANRQEHPGSGLDFRGLRYV